MRQKRNKMKSAISTFLVVAISAFIAFSAGAQEAPVGPRESAIKALGYHPQLKALQNAKEAAGHEEDRVRGGYYPRVDLLAGYGAESHNDEVTRVRSEDESEWDERLELSLRLTQLLYDGGKTSSLVGIEKARFESAEYRVLDNAESVALDAVIAHLEVYRQRELLDLAEKNEQDHRDYLAMLEERQRAGAGNAADISQAQGRLALARSSLAETRSNLSQATANYTRVVGTSPGDLAFTGIDQGESPASMEEALQQTREGNPKVKALGSGVNEATKKVRLSRANNYPLFNLELSSSYEDKIESSESYEQNNQAMVRMYWNLYNGGSDSANKDSAIARKYQAVSSQEDQIASALEETQTTWAKYDAARNRAQFFSEAVGYNKKTLDSYLKQFSVAQRTLLDLLDARNELFQSSGKLVTAKVNEVIAVMRLHALAGNLNKTMGIGPAIYGGSD